MTLGERIKKVRVTSSHTQQKFGERLGIKQNSIALIESNKRNPSDQLLLAICREFNVSEEWLKTGEGEMFVPTPSSTIDKLVDEFKLGEVEKQIILEFIQLDAKDRKGVIEYVQRLAANRTLQAVNAQTARPPTIQEEARAEAERYYQELVKEKKQALQAFTANKSDVG